MESILNQLFWLWTPVSYLPDWLRIFVVLFVILQLARYVIPPVVSLLCHFLKKLLYAVTYPVMALISSILTDRREAGNPEIPFWVDFMEGLFALLEQFFNKLIQLTRKRKRYQGKWSFYAAGGLAVLLTAAIVHHPNEWYAAGWKKLELPQENQAEPTTTKAAAPTLKEYVLHEQFKDGGNVRDAPNLSARLLYTITVGEAVYYMDEEQADSRGIKWLKVKTADGKVIGWISANIVREK